MLCKVQMFPKIYNIALKAASAMEHIGKAGKGVDVSNIMSRATAGTCLFPNSDIKPDKTSFQHCASNSIHQIILELLCTQLGS